MRTYTRRRPECQIIEGVRDLCRLCLQKPDETIPIFDESTDNIFATLSLRIMICVGLEMTREDCLPNIICLECYTELSRYYVFRKKCELSYQKLKLHIQAMKEERLMLVKTKQIKAELVFDSNAFKKQSWLNETEVSELMLTYETGQLPDNGIKTDVHGVKQNDPQVISPSETDLDVSSFLSSILLQLGVIMKGENKVEVVDPTINQVEMIMGDNNAITFELMEEAEEVTDDNNDAASIPTEAATPGTYSSESNYEVTTQALVNNSEDINGTENGAMGVSREAGSGGGGRAWCSACRKWLASAGTLRRHQLVHTGERPYSCRDCGREFSQRESAKRHRLVHLKQKPFQCVRCVKSFTQRSALEKHLVGHDPPHSRALMLHRCTKCPKVYLYLSSLSRHMQSHKGFLYVCGGCDRTFSDKSSLLRHVRNTNHAAAVLRHHLPSHHPSPTRQRKQILLYPFRHGSSNSTLAPVARKRQESLDNSVGATSSG